jgi:hypothetical protein
MMIQSPSRHPVTYEVVKRDKRLWLREVETGRLVYTPPNFMRHRLQSREPMIELAKAMTQELRYDIDVITQFETWHTPKP